MKRQIGILILVLITSTVFSQEFVISNVRENILYYGMENYIEAIVSNTPCKSIYLISDNGMFTKSKGCGFFFKPLRTGIAQIRVIKLLKKDTIEIGKSIFRIKDFPEPVAKVADKKGGTIRSADLRAQTGIIPSVENIDICVNFLVTSFTVMIIHKNDPPIIRNIQGNLLSELRMEFSLLVEGDYVLFTKIKAKTPDGEELSLKPIEFVISQ